MADSVNLAEEFAPPETKAEPVDIASEFEAPPKEEQYAIINDATEKAHQIKRAFMSGTPEEQTIKAVSLLDEWKGRLRFNFDKLKTDAAPGIEAANRNLIDLPEVSPKNMALLQATGDRKLPIIAGAYNALAPIVSSFTSPVGIGVVGLFGGLTKAAQLPGAAGTFAKTALAGLSTGFAADTAKSVGEGAANVVGDFEDPNATTGETSKDIVSTAAHALMSVVAAGHAAKTGFEITSPKGEPTNANPITSSAQEVRVDASPETPSGQVAEGKPSGPVETPGTSEAPKVEELTHQEAKEQVVKNAIKTPGVKYQYTVFRMDENGPAVVQIDAISPEGSSIGSMNLEDLKKAGVELPEVPDSLPQGQYTPEQVRAAAAPKPDLAEEFSAPAEGSEAHAAITEELAAQPETTTKLESEVEAPKDNPTAVMNAVVDQERADRGLEPVIESQRRSDPEAWDAAMDRLNKNPQAGDQLIESLRDEPRALNDIDIALIRHRRITLTEKFDKVASSIVNAADAGDMQRVAELTPERDRLSDELTETDNAAKLSKAETGRGLRALRVLQNKDFSLATMVTRRRAINEGRPLSPDQMAEVMALHEKIAETQKAFDEYVAKNNSRSAKPSQSRSSSVTRLISERANEARSRIAARLEKSFTAQAVEGEQNGGLLSKENIDDIATVAADYISRGIDAGAELIKEFGEKIKPHLNAILDKASKELEGVYSQESRLKSFKTRTTNKISDLERRVEENDFSRRQQIELSKDKEANALQARLEAAKEEYAAALERDRYENLSNVQKAKEQGIGFYDMARTLMTTGELSFVLRQGKMAALGHPIMTAKTLPTAFRALMASPEAAHAMNLEILNHPDAGAARAAKLHLLEKGQSLNKQEEILMAAQLAEKIPFVGKAVRGFNQAAEAFLNKLRFDLWRSMRGVGGLTAIEDRQIAKFVNESTGRGSLGPGEAAAVPLGRVMFSPRFFASRLQLLVGHSLWGGTPRTRQIIAKEYARALVGLAAYYGAIELRNQFVDDKDKAKIGVDPRSSDFGKIKLGNTRLDPLAGLSQMVVFGARTATGEKVNSKGLVKPIRGKHVPFGGDKWSDVAANFARSKLHPIPGAIINLFDGTDLAGNEATLGSQAVNLSAPLTYVDIYQALKEQDLPEGIALGLLATLGEGLQTYGAKKSKASAIKEDAPVQLATP